RKVLLPTHSRRRQAEQIDGDERINTVPLAVSIEGRFSLQALRGALHWLVARHDALRLCLVEHGAKLCPCAPAPPPELLCNEMAVASEAEEEAALTAFAAERWRHGRELPIRAALVRRDATHATLLLLLHHAAVDGWSSAIIARELAHAYNALAAGAP